MSTEAAQRRLLEALAAQDKTSGGLDGLLLGMPLAVDIARATDQPALADVWQALSDLAKAIQADLRTEATHG